MKKPNDAFFNLIGVSFEQSNVYDKLTGLENLEFFRSLFSVPTMEQRSCSIWWGSPTRRRSVRERIPRG